MPEDLSPITILFNEILGYIFELNPDMGDDDTYEKNTNSGDPSNCMSRDKEEAACLPLGSAPGPRCSVNGPCRFPPPIHRIPHPPP